MGVVYSYVLDGSTLEEFLEFTARDRRQLLKIFQQLSKDPYQSGESIVLDVSDRIIYVKSFGQWQMSFWSDHAVNEVRIIGIRRLKK